MNDDTRSTRPGIRTAPARGRTWGRRVLILIPGGCLALTLLILLSNWITFETLGRGSTTASGVLDWQEAYGTQTASEPPQTTVSVSGNPSVFSLPQVLSVEDAVETNDRWTLLDRRLGKVHLLHKDSGLIRSLGQEGEGPGELRRPLALALQDTLLWVVNQQGFSLDIFSLESGFLVRERITGGGCLAGLAKRLASAGPGGALFMHICPATLPGPGTAWVESLSPDGELRPILSLPLGREGSRQLHPFRQPALAAGSGMFYFGTWDAPCLLSFTTEGNSIGRFCLPDSERASVPEEEKAMLEERFQGITRMGLLPMEVPDLLPWYDAVFSTSVGPVVRRIRGESDRDLVLLFPDGTTSVIDRLFPESTFVGERSILVVRDLLQGTEIRIFRNPWTG